MKQDVLFIRPKNLNNNINNNNNNTLNVLPNTNEASKHFTEDKNFNYIWKSTILKTPSKTKIYTSVEKYN